MNQSSRPLFCSLAAVVVGLLGCGGGSLAGGGGGHSGGGAQGGGGKGGGTAGDDGGQDEPSPRCALSETYAWTDQYVLRLATGATGWVKSMTLSPPTGFDLMFLPSLDVPATTCAGTLPACGDPNLIDVSDIEAAIADPDVQAVFAQTPAPTYGPTSPTADLPGEFTLAHGGRSAFVGLTCDPPSSCVTPAPGVAALVDLMRGLFTQQLADPSCASADGGAVD